MKRARVHVTFACAALGCALLAGYHGTRLEHAKRVNAAIARADTVRFDSAKIDTALIEPGQLDSAVPEAVFARARVLSRVGDYRDAAKTYKLLIQRETVELRADARYNLGNLYLREALKNGAETAIQSVPLIELAKQSYRDLLRDNPMDWDARYNLELALRLAPEVSDAAIVESGPEVWNKRVLRATPGFRIELP
jgi:mxaK protein